MKRYVLLLIFFLCIGTVRAATVHGDIYDLSLERVHDAIVNVNSTPEQVFVAVNGSYSFDLPPGDYVIKASYKNESFDEQNVTVTEETGDFVIDLILFPNLEEERGVFEEQNASNTSIIEETTQPANPASGAWAYLVVLAFIVLVGVGAYFYINKLKPLPQEEELSEDLKRLMEAIKKQGGRATQKELRKEIPVSEAKMSLMIAELEAKGVVKKIKKGRGNIIILN